MKIALIGYGKMGKEIERIALERGHEIVCIIDVDNIADFDSEAFRSADVAIEFTAPSVAFSNYQRCFAAGIPVVTGTHWISSTGWIRMENSGISGRSATTIIRSVIPAIFRSGRSPAMIRMQRFSSGASRFLFLRGSCAASPRC